MVTVVYTLKVYIPQFIGKNIGNVISWDQEVVSTWNFDRRVLLTKEVAFIFIFEDVFTYVNYVNYTTVTLPSLWC